MCKIKWFWLILIPVLVIISTSIVCVASTITPSYQQIGTSGNSGLLVAGGTATSHLYVGTLITGTSTLPPYTGNVTGSGILSGNPLMPPQMYTELDTSKIPGGAIVDDILDQSDTPPALWWFPFIFCFIGILALLIYGLTVKTGGEGSLLIMCVVIEAGLILFGIMGVTNTSSIIPLFPMFLFLLPAIAMIMSKKHYNW